MRSHVTAFRPISEAARSWSDDNVFCIHALYSGNIQSTFLPLTLSNIHRFLTFITGRHRNKPFLICLLTIPAQLKYVCDVVCVCVCVDIDECSSGVAACHVTLAHCRNTLGGFHCHCIAGYTGDGHDCTG